MLGEESSSSSSQGSGSSSGSDSNGRGSGRQPHSHSSGSTQRKQKRASEHDLDKVRSTLKQFVRDWSEEGRAERAAAYGPILDALAKIYPPEQLQRSSVENEAPPRVLVPGAGLGRLAWEITSRGMACQGNEFSFFMLVASHFVLNNTQHVGEHTIYPFIHSASNWRSAHDMLRAVQVPDVLPSALPQGVDFSMVAGEVSRGLG